MLEFSDKKKTDCQHCVMIFEERAKLLHPGSGAHAAQPDRSVRKVLRRAIPSINLSIAPSPHLSREGDLMLMHTDIRMQNTRG